MSNQLTEDEILNLRKYRDQTDSPINSSEIELNNVEADSTQPTTNQHNTNLDKAEKGENLSIDLGVLMGDNQDVEERILSTRLSVRSSTQSAQQSSRSSIHSARLSSRYNQDVIDSGELSAREIDCTESGASTVRSSELGEPPENDFSEVVVRDNQNYDESNDIDSMSPCEETQEIIQKSKYVQKRITDLENDIITNKHNRKKRTIIRCCISTIKYFIYFIGIFIMFNFMLLLSMHTYEYLSKQHNIMLLPESFYKNKVINNTIDNTVNNTVNNTIYNNIDNSQIQEITKEINNTIEKVINNTIINSRTLEDIFSYVVTNLQSAVLESFNVVNLYADNHIGNSSIVTNIETTNMSTSLLIGDDFIGTTITGTSLFGDTLNKCNMGKC